MLDTSLTFLIPFSQNRSDFRSGTKLEWRFVTSPAPAQNIEQEANLNSRIFALEVLFSQSKCTFSRATEHAGNKCGSILNERSINMRNVMFLLPYTAFISERKNDSFQ